MEGRMKKVRYSLYLDELLDKLIEEYRRRGGKRSKNEVIVEILNARLKQTP